LLIPLKMNVYLNVGYTTGRDFWHRTRRISPVFTEEAKWLLWLQWPGWHVRKSWSWTFATVVVGEEGVRAERQNEQSFCLSDSEWLWLGIDFQKVQPVGIITSPAIVCLDCLPESGVEEVAALARRYAQAAAASRSVLGATATGLSLQRDKKLVYPSVSPTKNVSW
jgi:hypothetical protein